MALRAVLLDVDGTLIDSNDAHAEAFVESLADHGYDVAFEEIRRRIGMGGDKLLAETVGLWPDDERAGKINQGHGERFKAHYLPRLKPFPRVRDLLERMQASGFDLIAASSAEEAELKPLLEQAGVADLMKARTSATEVEHSKPDPDIVQAALRKAGCAPEEAVMLGDTPYDVEAATRAGVKIIAVRCGGWTDADLAGAIAIYDDAADLLAHYEASPLQDGLLPAAGKR